MTPRHGWIEIVNDQLKNIHQIDHSRHRSVYYFVVNLVAYGSNPAILKLNITFKSNSS